MKTMKNFLIYALMVIAVIVATKLIPNIVLNTNYTPISNYKIETLSPEIVIEKAEATNVNGKIKGKITNKTNNFMENYFIKIDLLSDLGNILGEEYIQVGNLQPKQSQNFELNFKYNKVSSFTIAATNEVDTRNIQYHPLIEHAREFYLLARLVIFATTPGTLFLPLFLFK